mmetsp:Transcript_110961/g.320699  ORF Transcript_110961/g.320699 Transcript_110961/m.320699 type:complete len:297 (+) Transcript_110961:467-1357(+)
MAITIIATPSTPAAFTAVHNISKPTKTSCDLESTESLQGPAETKRSTPRELLCKDFGAPVHWELGATKHQSPSVAPPHVSQKAPMVPVQGFSARRRGNGAMNSALMSRKRRPTVAVGAVGVTGRSQLPAQMQEVFTSKSAGAAHISSKKLQSMVVFSRPRVARISFSNATASLPKPNRRPAAAVVPQPQTSVSWQIRFAVLTTSGRQRSPWTASTTVAMMVTKPSTDAAVSNIRNALLPSVTPTTNADPQMGKPSNASTAKKTRDTMRLPHQLSQPNSETTRNSSRETVVAVSQRV